MEDITQNKINSAGKFPERIAGHHAGFKLRAVGLLYLIVGAIFIWFVVMVPRIIKATVPYDYHVPHACECLECLHGYKTGPDGNLYCAKYLPKEILDRNISPFIKKARLITGAFFGILGLLSAVLMSAAGFLWLLGLWIPARPARWYTVICRLAPLIVILLWTISFFIRAIYPIPPR
jgi:hypothetical protein